MSPRLRVELWANDVLVADSDDPSLWAKVFTVVAAQSVSGGGDRAELTASTAKADQPTTPSSAVDRHADTERQSQRSARPQMKCLLHEVGRGARVV